MIYFIVLCFIIFIDQFTKRAALNILKDKKEKIKILNGKIQLFFVKNYGAAFNILSSRRKILIMSNITGFAVLIVFLVYSFMYLQSRVINIAIVFMLAGGISNFIDRIKRGYVIDFIYFNIKKWPVFNIADFFIFGGSILFLVCMI